MRSAVGQAPCGGSSTRASRASFAWLTLSCAACSGSGPLGGVVPAADRCVVAADSSAPHLNTVTVALAEPELATEAATVWPFAGRLIERHLGGAADTDCLGLPIAANTAPAVAPLRAYSRAPDAIVLGPTDSTQPLRLRFVRLPRGHDARDALDGQLAPSIPRIDVLVTRDAQTIAYARGRREFVTRPLLWDRTYILAAFGATMPDAGTRAALASDAVRADVRGAEPPFWWLDDPRCTAGPTGSPGAATIVAYAEGDPIARDLAERVVALAGMGNESAWLGQLAGRVVRSAPIPAARLDSALHRGQASAAVVAWPTRAPEDCDGLPGRIGGGPAPLVDSRAYLIVRRGAPGLVIDGEGTFLLLTGSGR